MTGGHSIPGMPTRRTVTGPHVTPFAKWMRRARRTQTDVAAALGISQGYLARLLAGHRQPSLPLAIEIARVTGLSVDALVPIRKGNRGADAG